MISISNIAWDVSIDQEVSELMLHHGLRYIDIAPTKYFEHQRVVSENRIMDVKKYWLDKGIKPLGMQSLLYGTQGLNIFGSADIQQRLLGHLSKVCQLGNVLDARKLVFGSPKSRDRKYLNDEETLDISVRFLRRLGDIAKSEQVVICLEPNPACYQSNFMTDSLETANIVKAVEHDNIKMQLDIGAMIINEEHPEGVIKEVAPVVHHIHISEPQLAPLNIHNSFHILAADAIKHYLPKMPMTIEILTTNNSMSLKEIDQSIHVVKKIYQG